jgi:hypothetical protein
MKRFGFVMPLCPTYRTSTGPTYTRHSYRRFLGVDVKVKRDAIQTNVKIITAKFRTLAAQECQGQNGDPTTTSMHSRRSAPMIPSRTNCQALP